jgi:hypothetical protein
MPGIVVAAILLASLLLVHFSIRSRPIQAGRPLDVDFGLPLPEVAQASTVFSLTALFGAYLGIYMLVGLSGLAGLACGTVLGLFLIRRWVAAHGDERFEQFLARVFGSQGSNSAVLALSVTGVQFAFATSELLILRELARLALGVRPEQATLFTIGVGLIGYFYVLFGGYLAVFRTDVLQFVMVATMAIVFSVSLPPGTFSAGWIARVPGHPGYWSLLAGAPRIAVHAYHFGIALVMGVGFLAASPDAWKRVFLVVRIKKQTRFRFLVFVLVGIAPFLAMIPFALAAPPLADGVVDTRTLFSGMFARDVLFVAAALGLIASVLSAFNSALVVGVHCSLMFQRARKSVAAEIGRFHWTLAAGLLVVFSLFHSFRELGNPYLLANLLLGAYAIVAGVQVATGGVTARLKPDALIWIVVPGAFAWFLYFLAEVEQPRVPTTYEINTVPGGVLLFFMTLLACRLIARQE